MQRTKISYLTHTWNPLAMRCTPVSPGCQNCWHIAMAKRHAGNPILKNEERDAWAGGKPVLRAKELETPLRMRKSARIGVQFMGDLFHEDVPDEVIDRVFAVAALCPQHIFIMLTKRAERMAEYTLGLQTVEGAKRFEDQRSDPMTLHRYAMDFRRGKPLPNVWAGVSVENQATADERIPHLLRTPAAVRFVSIEPMLGEVRLKSIATPGSPHSDCASTLMLDALDGFRATSSCSGTQGPSLDWVIVGCESGPKRRHCEVEWVRGVVEECQYAGVPVCVKQYCNFAGDVLHPEYMPDGSIAYPDAWPEDVAHHAWPEVVG